jgi:hypothetical protein
MEAIYYRFVFGASFRFIQSQMAVPLPAANQLIADEMPLRPSRLRSKAYGSKHLVGRRASPG